MTGWRKTRQTWWRVALITLGILGVAVSVVGAHRSWLSNQASVDVLRRLMSESLLRSAANDAAGASSLDAFPDGRASYVVGAGAVLLGDAKTAEEALARTMTAEGGRRQLALYLLGELARKSGDVPLALERLRQAGAGHRFLSLARQRRGRDASAAVELYEWATWVSQELDVFAEASNYIRDADKARWRRFVLELSRMLGVESPLGLLGQGELAVYDGRYGDAVRILQRVVQADPVNHRAYYFLALASLYTAKQSADASALRYLERAVALKEDDAWYRYVLAVNLLKDGMPDKAVTQLDVAVTLADDEPLFWDQLSLAQAAVGMREQALLSCRKAIELVSERALSQQPNCETQLGHGRQ